MTKNEVIRALKKGGDLAGMTEKEWLAELIVDFEDWLLADTRSARELLLHALSTTHAEDDGMIDRIEHFVLNRGENEQV